jgi:hypothetical protein
MKRQFLLLGLTVIIYGTGIAQTNTFPATGNVGIGTLAPLEKLTVLTASAVSGITHTDGVIKVGTFVGGGAGYLGTVSNHPLFLRTNNGAAQAALLQNGNFGIGTTAPGERLTVLSASGVVGFAHTNGAVKVGSFLNATGAYFGTVTNHPFYLRSNSITQVSILQNGRVGIGTTVPIGKLDVRGEDAYIQMVRVGTGGGNDSSNTCVGRNSLFKNHALVTLGYEGFWNTAVGCNSLREMAYGNSNTAVGYAALEKDSAGVYSTAVGAYALTNSNSAANTAVGFQALMSTTTGGNNCAVGIDAMQGNISGNFNSAIGGRSLFWHKSGDFNTALGYFALFGDTTGADNTAVGNRALQFNGNGSRNTVVGSEAMYFNRGGNDNTAVGYRALDSNTTGIQNTATGLNSLYKNKTGNYNTATGRYALYNTLGSENTGVGDDALYYNVTGYNNTGVGYLATPNTPALHNTSAFGYNARTTANDQVRLGNSAVLSIGGYQNWTNISDGRVKKNIKENVPGLSFINKLKPVTYNLNLDVADKLTKHGMAKQKVETDERLSKEIAEARAVKERMVFTGFVAQDVEKAAKSLKYEFSGVDAAKNDQDLYGLRYAEFVVPLVKSVQELSKMNDEKEAKINDLQKQIDELKTLIKFNSGNAGPQKINISSAMLGQNVPNPFNSTTRITYTLPEQYSTAKIVITDKSGKLLREMKLNGKGQGSIYLDAKTSSSGAYQYSLYVNENLVDTKQMLIAK